MRRLFPEGVPVVWHPVDDALISGPRDMLRNPAELFTPDLLRNVDAVLGFEGSLGLFRENLINTPTIMNLSASTVMGDHTRKMPLSSVRYAVQMGAEAVAFHINFTSPAENEMLRNFSRVVREAGKFGMPVVAIAYVRGVSAHGADDDYLGLRVDDPQAYGRKIQHAVRVAVELGASAVKTTYTGSAESFARVIDGSCGIPVLIAGEKLAPSECVFERAVAAVQVGARGVVFGRQIFERKDRLEFLTGLRARLIDACQRRLVPAGNGGWS